jgi:hypothetical protein
MRTEILVFLEAEAFEDEIVAAWRERVVLAGTYSSRIDLFGHLILFSLHRNNIN